MYKFLVEISEKGDKKMMLKASELGLYIWDGDYTLLDRACE